MPIPFSRTMRALEADRFAGSAALLAGGMAFLLAWLAWFVAARVSVYAVTADARLEVDRAVYTFEAPVSGRVTAAPVSLEQKVEAGALLFELEAESEKLRLVEARAHQEALHAQRAALLQQQNAGTRALGQAGNTGIASLEESRARYDEAEAAARLAESERDRLRPLREKRFIADAEYDRAAAEAVQKRAAAEALRRNAQRVELANQQERSDRRAVLEALTGELARLDGEIATTAAAVARLEHDIGQRQVRAPVAGHVGELAELRAGAFVTAGDRLGSIVPSGELRLVARFAPAAAIGRIAAGQKATLRLNGFPSTRYGSIAAVVSRVAGEVQDGLIRVELAIRPGAGAHLPLQHGLPGTVEVIVERASPAALVLRRAGQLVQAQ